MIARYFPVECLASQHGGENVRTFTTASSRRPAASRCPGVSASPLHVAPAVGA